MQEKNDPCQSTRGLRRIPNANVNVSIETAVSLKRTPKKSIRDLCPRTIESPRILFNVISTCNEVDEFFRMLLGLGKNEYDWFEVRWKELGVLSFR